MTRRDRYPFLAGAMASVTLGAGSFMSLILAVMVFPRPSVWAFMFQDAVFIGFALATQPRLFHIYPVDRARRR